MDGIKLDLLAEQVPFDAIAIFLIDHEFTKVWVKTQQEAKAQGRSSAFFGTCECLLSRRKGRKHVDMLTLASQREIVAQDN